MLNGNVKVGSAALFSQKGKMRLFQVDGRETGCNSLRPPEVSEPTKRIRVEARTSDDYLGKENVNRIDFIKMDAEGAELDILRGGIEFLRRKPRPVILCEIRDTRIRSWNYDAKEIAYFLTRCDYDWFKLVEDGKLMSLCAESDDMNGNFLAVPSERMREVSDFVEAC